MAEVIEMNFEDISVEFLICNILVTAATSGIIYLAVNLVKRAFSIKQVGEDTDPLKLLPAYKNYCRFGFPLTVISVVFCFLATTALMQAVAGILAFLFAFFTLAGYIGLVEAINYLDKQNPKSSTNNAGNDK